jgi:Ras GTPase-activating-like protein IQGAP2/3
MRLAERHIAQLQAHARGVLVRRWLNYQRQRQAHLTPWVISLQAVARGVITRRRWRAYVRRIKQSSQYVTKIQAQLRGILQRRRYAQFKAALRRSTFSVVKLQSVARARIARNIHHEVAKSFARPVVRLSVVALQAAARGALQRRRVNQHLGTLKRFSRQIIELQARCRGVIVRRRMRAQMAKLEDVTHIVIRIQASVRTYLARKRLLKLIRGLRKATPMIIGLQACARASLVRQQHRSIVKALSQVKIVNAVGSFQARARAAITRNRHQEQSKCFAFVEPDVIGFQAVCRGALVRWDYWAWRNHLRESQLEATLLQAMLRGVLQRRRFRAKMNYFRANLQKVVKIQSLFRGKERREQYHQLTLGTNVTVGTIKNFVHLLDDSEADFQEEIKVERLRKMVVEGIRENQALENDVNDLDVKIALVVQNAKRRHGADSAAAHAERSSVLAAHGDPFAGASTLDHTARRKLELYQQLFYLLQTKGEYLSRLFVRISLDNTPEKNRRLTERVVLTLFGYGQDHRENYLLLKMFQVSPDDLTVLSSVKLISFRCQFKKRSHLPARSQMSFMAILCTSTSQSTTFVQARSPMSEIRSKRSSAM